MKALIIVDLQNDFLPGGSLAVANGRDIIPVIRQLMSYPFDYIIATKDWHPPEHGSFGSTHGKAPGGHIILDGIDQILWPAHCIQNTFGAEFANGCDWSQIDQVIYKGTEKNIDSYSTFHDNGHRRATGLQGWLEERKINDLYIAGLATDYCVKYSVIDALKIGFNVFVIADGCKGVNLQPDDSARSLDEMRRLGAHIIRSEDLLDDSHSLATQ